MNPNTKIKVVGVGGAGGNAISRMALAKIQGVELIALNCDAQDLKKTKASQVLQIGRNLTKGLGAGMNSEIGRLAAEEQKEEINQLLKGADMIFITCGLGGGTGTGAAPVVAELAKNLGALVVAVVTTPFSFEGTHRAQVAREGLEVLKSKVDTLLIIPNDKILSQGDTATTLVSAFWRCDEILRQAVQGITDLIFLPGIINVDFADLRTIMKDSGPAFFGQGQAKGERRVETAVNLAVNSPLINVSISGARGILYNVSGGGDLSLDEIAEASKIITKNADARAKVIFGAVQDARLPKGEIKITVIATGFGKK
ncbi:MAG: cell division protein FtsZ [Candidatus Nealsonbacteria bacterium CG09_land_8_20_14_0_10_42_14]|uniref:Cell division protein FtsZ n=1 Tax=Candidatus Nealsonbacteria bacterium CG09_land_8_20_14_0_10_42_14 TaxID=1974707 RepID=A0A2H0WY44_9BACT|nr:MAG: cell division protein FtsZ [Candidatus Nealsonbacteria bacterium CG09_land_8_20_14_0_10_42_14]